MKKTLVLDKNYQPINFISTRKLIKFMVNDKVEIVSYWKEEFVDGERPSIVRLKDYVRKNRFIKKFSRKVMFRRDGYICQYTGKKYPPSKLTVDHIVPRSKGGKNSWTNCVTASHEANVLKGSKTLEEAGLKLLKKPEPPPDPVLLEFEFVKDKHPDWSMYFQSFKKNRIK